MDDTSRRVDELRGDIEQTRDEMSDTIGEIQERLRPANLVAKATDRVKQATIEGVRDMTDSATESARGAMSSRVIPLAMIGLGAAWLVIEQTSHASDNRSSWRDSEPGRFRYQWEREETARWRNSSKGHRYSTASDDFGVSPESVARVRARSGEMRANVQGIDDDMGSESLMDRVGGTARWTQNRVQRMVRDNPLLVGAGALLLGAAFGLAVPETDVENQWMGDARDSVMDRAQQMAHDAAQKVKDSAESLADAAGRIATGGDTSA